MEENNEGFRIHQEEKRIVSLVRHQEERRVEDSGVSERERERERECVCVWLCEELGGVRLVVS